MPTPAKVIFDMLAMMSKPAETDNPITRHHGESCEQIIGVRKICRDVKAPVLLMHIFETPEGKNKEQRVMRQGWERRSAARRMLNVNSHLTS